jgi:hypothetical protein
MSSLIMGDLGCDEFDVAVNNASDWARLSANVPDSSETRFHRALPFPAAFNSADGVGNHNQGADVPPATQHGSWVGRSRRGMVDLPAQSIGQGGLADE